MKLKYSLKKLFFGAIRAIGNPAAMYPYIFDGAIKDSEPSLIDTNETSAAVKEYGRSS